MDATETSIESPTEEADTSEPGISTASQAVESMFCSCGGLRIPSHDWECQACGQSGSRPEPGLSLTTQQEAQEISVIPDTFYIGPKTTAKCPKCEHDEAYYRLQQTRSADESETRFFTCAHCEHEWREND
jgi:DNA-directed RNA polymerase subunit M